MKIGVLALQGDFKEHIEMFKKCNVETKEIRLPADLDDVDGLIIPGGESTSISNLMQKYKLDKKIKEKYNEGMPIFGTCAGAILLAKEIINNKLSNLGLLNVSVKRNDYGRQIDSFEADIEINNLGGFRGIFIRAPVIENIYNGVEVLSEFNGKAILVKGNGLLAATFHPELTGNLSLHKYFIKMVRNKD